MKIGWIILVFTALWTNAVLATGAQPPTVCPALVETAFATIGRLPIEMVDEVGPDELSLADATFGVADVEQAPMILAAIRDRLLAGVDSGQYRFNNYQNHRAYSLLATLFGSMYLAGSHFKIANDYQFFGAVLVPLVSLTVGFKAHDYFGKRNELAHAKTLAEIKVGLTRFFDRILEATHLKKAATFFCVFRYRDGSSFTLGLETLPKDGKNALSVTARINAHPAATGRFPPGSLGRRMAGIGIIALALTVFTPDLRWAIHRLGFNLYGERAATQTRGANPFLADYIAEEFLGNKQRQADTFDFLKGAARHSPEIATLATTLEIPLTDVSSFNNFQRGQTVSALENAIRVRKESLFWAPERTHRAVSVALLRELRAYEIRFPDASGSEYRQYAAFRFQEIAARERLVGHLQMSLDNVLALNSSGLSNSGFDDFVDDMTYALKGKLSARVAFAQWLNGWKAKSAPLMSGVRTQKSDLAANRWLSNGSDRRMPTGTDAMGNDLDFVPFRGLFAALIERQSRQESEAGNGAMTVGELIQRVLGIDLSRE